MRFDLFKLHDPVLDDKPKKWISAKGSGLEKTLATLIEKLAIQGLTKAAISKQLMKKFGISKPTE